MGQGLLLEWFIGFLEFFGLARVKNTVDFAAWTTHIISSKLNSATLEKKKERRLDVTAVPDAHENMIFMPPTRGRKEVEEPNEL